MTALTADRTTPSTPAAADGGLRTVLRVDAVVTAVAGAFAVLGPKSSYGEVPGWLPRVAGALFVLTGIELFVASRATGDRLRLIGTICAGLAAAWVVATVAILELADLPARGEVILGVVGAATLVFALLERKALATTRVKAAASRRSR